MDLAGKTIILTGAKRIGREVALKLAQQKLNLVFSYLNSSDDADFLCKEVESLGSKATAIKADLSKEEDINNLVDETVKKFGGVDILIHMAANYPKTSLGKITAGDFNKTMDIIALSSLLLGQRVGEEMKKGRGGKMIFFSDWSVLKNPYPEYIVYNASKAAVEAITKTFAKAYGPKVSVNAIAPGPILKPEGLSEKENEEVLNNTPLHKWGGAEEIAKAVMYLLEADFVTGIILPVDGGRSIG